MKICTLTCHDVYNQGASLQAYALQHYLETQGHEVRIIDYKPDYLSGHYSLTSVCNSIYDRPFLKQLYLLAKLPGRLKGLARKRVFDEFTFTYLHLTRRYPSYEALKANPPEAELYIAGSDQIWNTLFRNGKDAAFYLDFGEKDTRRISYAASFATQQIEPGYESFVAAELQNLDAVSIREKLSLPLLKSLGREDGVAVCDPVFLLSSDEWNRWIEHVPTSSDKYLLVYLTDRSKQIEEISKAIKKATGWKIYVVGGFKEAWADRCLVNAGPVEFVRLVKDAQYVISNSFHATAFALIFEKNFSVVNRTEDINERMKSLLDQLELSHRLVSEFNVALLEDIDYKGKINQLLQESVSFSKHWLNDAIETFTRKR